MSEQIALDRRYMITVYEPSATAGTLIVTLGPRGLMHERGLGGSPKRVPKYMVTVRKEADGLVFDWSGTQDDPGDEREEIQEEIARRVKDRAVWIDRVTALVDQVEQWAKELGWSTRRVQKLLDGEWNWKHQVPALLMQEDTCRVLLEPVGESTLGTEGVVDFYLMPAYDDIARIYYNRGQWNVHYPAAGTEPVATVREAEAMPLSRQIFEQVLGELKNHAA